MKCLLHWIVLGSVGLYWTILDGTQWNSSEVFVALDSVGLYWTILDGTPWNLSEVSVILDRSLI